MAHQSIDQRAAPLLQGDGDAAKGEVGAQLPHPLLQGLRTLRQNEGLDSGRTGRLQFSVMLLVSPIQADPSDDVGNRGRHVFHLLFGKWENTLAGAGDSPYSGVVTRQHLSIRCRLQRPAPLEGLSPVVERRGVKFVAGRGVSCQLFHKPFLPRLPPAFAAGG